MTIYAAASQESKKADVETLYESLASVDLSPWFMSGAMLGALIHQDTLPGDRDIDLGLLASDRAAFDRAIPLLEEKGFKMLIRFDPVTEKPKNMVTMQRHSLPIDIKFFEVNEGLAYREIHKSLDRRSKLTWEVIDLLHYGHLPMNSKFRSKSVSLAKAMEIVTGVTPKFIRNSIKKKLCSAWRNGNTTYGVETHLVDLFSGTVEAIYAGTTILIPKGWNEYVVEEYGPEWKTQSPKGKGGWAKKSHLVLPRTKNEMDLLDDESRRRLEISGLI